MSDFVRKSDVLYLLYGIFDKYKMCTDKNTSIGKSFGTDVFEEIRNIPTAYNIDKVVEELELHSFELGTDTLPVHYVRLNEAIEIVKQGGDANYVCEWKKLPFSWFTGCDGRKVEYKQGDYCPRCGKKIKIKAVE